jgi:hypothetical protein
MADADRKPVVSIDPQYLLTAEVVERAPAERSKHDTIDTILDWLADPVRHMPRWSAGSTNSRGAFWRPDFRCCGRLSMFARCIRNTSVSALSGGAPPVKL